VADAPETAALWAWLLAIQPNVAELAEALEGVRQHRRIVARSTWEAERLATEDPGWWDVAPAQPDLSALVC
jgi:hypothetical protein